jgi:hypothetical protein
MTDFAAMSVSGVIKRFIYYVVFCIVVGLGLVVAALITYLILP